MEYVSLGTGSRKASRIGFGCWAIGGHGWGSVDDRTSITAIRRALDLGITFFDTADVYGFGHSEKVLSQALGRQRKDVVIATKFGVTWDDQGRIGRDCSAAAVVRALEASLKRLRVDCVPLYQIHWPDPRVPISETLEALERCRRQGKIDRIGCSNFSPTLLRESNRISRLSSLQIPYSLVDRSPEEELLSCAGRQEVQVVAYGVLCLGLLTGKYGRGISFPPGDIRTRDPHFRGVRRARILQLVNRMKEFGEGRGKTPAQIAIRWVLDAPGVSIALTGIKTPQQIEENAGASDWTLSEEERLSFSPAVGRTFPVKAR